MTHPDQLDQLDPGCPTDVDQLDQLRALAPWRTALSLRVAFDQLNGARPNRSRRSDGTIGNAAHQSSTSDHNAWIDDPAAVANVVSAADFTDDPAAGLDWTVADARAFLADPRAKYAIVDDTFVDRDARGAIRVRRYLDVNPRRTNPHRGHLHLSVQSAKALYDSSAPWDAITAKVGQSPTPAPSPAPSGPVALFVDGLLGPATIRRWQQVMGTPVDGVLSRPRSTLVEAVQRRLHAAPGTGVVKVDGVLGPQTIRALQRYLGTPVDGVLSKPSTAVRALQERLNRGGF